MVHQHSTTNDRQCYRRVSAESERTMTAKKSGAKKSAERTAKNGGQKRAKRSTKPTSTQRSSDSYSYSDRVPIIADTLRSDFDGAATIDALYAKLRTKSGEFNKARRIAATFRYDRRTNGDKSVLVRVGGELQLRSMSKAMRAKLNKRGQRDA